MDLLTTAAAAIDARFVGADAVFQRVVTDTRALQPGDLFVALRGERFDGHDYVLRAAALGAAGCLVGREIEGLPAQIIAADGDTLAALQALARHWRGQFKLPVVGVTGSSGKTTTKQMLALLAAARGPVLATEGNLNNHIGVPLTLLKLRPAHQTAVIEMGANHLGEIGLLAGLAQPDIGIVTMAGDAHLEGFGSRDGVAQGKGELFAALGAHGVAVINADDPYAGLWHELAGPAAKLSFGFSEKADVRAEHVELGGERSHFRLLTPSGHADADLPLPGRHNIANALGASACAIALGLQPEQIAAALALLRPVSGRMQWKTSREGARVLDDSYNANPSSVRAALDLLGGLSGRRWVVLADMKELGEHAEALHEDIGRQARLLGIERLYTYGPLARHAAAGFGQGRSFDDKDALIAALHAELEPHVALLVKGSHSMRMDEVVHALCGTPAGEMH